MGFATNIITTPVGRIIGLVGWSIIFALLLGSINGWYLQSVDAGVVDGERFDRVIVKGTSDTGAGDAWGRATGTSSDLGATGDMDGGTAYILSETATGNGCRLNTTTRTAATSADVEAYTPLGSKVKIPEPATATDDVVVSGCKFSEGSEVFNAGGLGGLIEIILQAAGLAPPIALMFELGSFGSSFLNSATGNPIMAAVMTAIVLLMVATLLNTFTPFLLIAFKAVDSTRFVMFAEGLGTISVVVRQFWGVVLVGSMLGIAWQVIKAMRGGGNNALAGAGSGRM